MNIDISDSLLQNHSFAPFAIEQWGQKRSGELSQAWGNVNPQAFPWQWSEVEEISWADQAFPIPLLKGQISDTRFRTVAKLTSKPLSWVVMLCTDMTRVAAEPSSSLLRYYFPPMAVIPSIAAKWIALAMQLNRCSLWLKSTCSRRERAQSIAKFVLELSALIIERDPTMP